MAPGRHRTLTPKQRQILRFIHDKVRERGYPPSVREIGEALGLRSTSTVHAHLSRLEEKGFIRRDPAKPRAIELLERDADGGALEVPILGRVAAGQPLLAAEQVEGWLSLPASIVRGERAFLLRVRGDSMVDAGIQDGDLVLVRPQPTVEDGEIAVILVGEEATVKRVYREGPRVRLQPANARLEPTFVPADDVRVVGKVIGVLRLFA